MLYYQLVWLAGGRRRGWCGVVWGLGSVRSQTKASLKLLWNNLKPQEVRRIKLFRVERSRGKKIFFTHF
jgi:hypothetical protein